MTQTKPRLGVQMFETGGARYRLENGIELDGARVHVIDVREPTFEDQDRLPSGGSVAERGKIMIANLCSVAATGEPIPVEAFKTGRFSEVNALFDHITTHFFNAEVVEVDLIEA